LLAEFSGESGIGKGIENGQTIDVRGDFYKIVALDGCGWLGKGDADRASEVEGENEERKYEEI
jgi:hypothetical protein